MYLYIHYLIMPWFPINISDFKQNKKYKIKVIDINIKFIKK